MKHTLPLTICIISLAVLLSCNKENKESVPNDNPPHIVFVTGDEEYRSEESMPMLAHILKKQLGAKITICYALDSLGIINPNINNNIEGLEALESADLAVFFMRWRELPKDSTMMHLNNDWPTKVFGQQWIVHHGHFSDGHDPLTSVSINTENNSAILNGVTPFDAYSWLYHVDGGDWKLYGDYKVLLKGTSLRSKQEAAGRLDEFPMTNPVAWTKSYTGKSGISSRVFFTTLGHPYDFKIESMRKFSLNGVYWALGKEDKIPPSGIDASLIQPYEPNNSGFGQKFKLNQRPVEIK